MELRIKVLSCGCEIVECVFQQNEKCTKSKEQHAEEIMNTFETFKCTPHSVEEFLKVVKLAKTNNWVYQIKNEDTILIPLGIKSDLFLGKKCAAIFWSK